MITPQEQTPDNQRPLTPLADFRKSGRAPVEMHHLIFHHKKSLVEHGAICKFGRKRLASEGHLFQWLRDHGANAGRPKRPKEGNTVIKELKCLKPSFGFQLSKNELALAVLISTA